MKEITPFLADTLWFGMTSRLSMGKLKDYATQRVAQGFNAVQVVVGIPPEVGPENRNAAGDCGPAWDLQGNLNNAYLTDCGYRIQMLNEIGLKVIIYGAWGHQISWVGADLMEAWWSRILYWLEEYDVYYCLCGESNLWIGQAGFLLPDKTTGDSPVLSNLQKLSNRFPFNKLRQLKFLKAIYYFLLKPAGQSSGKTETLEERKAQWSEVAHYVSQNTKKPLFIHTTHTESSLEAINNPEVLAAVTTQTSHLRESKNRHWQEPIRILKEHPQLKYINLEPWYEGILNDFYEEDQLFAYWANMLGGASAYCYGAHGVWNVGDGKFLSQWGTTTFKKAMESDTPRLIGLSHRFFLDTGAMHFPTVVADEKNGELISICRQNQTGSFVIYFPNYHPGHYIAGSKIFDPLTGRTVDTSGTPKQAVLVKK